MDLLQTISQGERDGLSKLLYEIDFEKKRVKIADTEYTDHGGLTFYLEDKYNPRGTFDACLQITINIKSLADYIRINKLNTYRGTVKKGLHYLPTDVVIAEPLDWFCTGTTTRQRDDLYEQIALELVDQLLTPAEGAK